MDDSIYKNQNSRKVLLLQKAQRKNYSKAKKLLYRGFSFTIICTVIFSVLTSRYNNELLNTFSTFFAMLVFALTRILEKQSNKFIELAAKIQQTIDCKLFHLPNNSHVLLSSEVNEIVALDSLEGLAEFENWYSDYSSMVFFKQIFYSQKENIHWNEKLTDKYSFILWVAATGFPFILIIYSIVMNITVITVFAIASWLFPIEQFVITQLIGLKDNLNHLKKVNQEFLNLEQNYEKYFPDQIKCKLCGLQQNIFEHRKNSLMIPDWFYNKHKSKMQKHEDNIALETSKMD